MVTIKDTLRGNLEDGTRDDCTAEQVLMYSTILLQALQKLPFGVTTMLPNSPWAKVAVHGVDLAFFADEKEGMAQLQQEITNNNPDIKLKTALRYLTSPAQRATKTHFSIVLAVETEQMAQTIINKCIYQLTSLLKAI